MAARLEALQFITPANLEIPDRHRFEPRSQPAASAPRRAVPRRSRPSRSKVESQLALAQKELQKINTYKAPRDKLVCVLNCCRVINNLLVSSAGKDSPPGADDFLPVLVLVLLRAQPAQLPSNLAFIMRFRLASRLVSEASYYFTNLVSATHFLETAEPSQFKNVDAADFWRRMVAAGLGGPPTPLPPLPLPSAPRSGRAASGAPGDSVSRWSVDELTAVGEAMLASSGPEAAGRLSSRHRYYGVSSATLTVAEVPQLLDAYAALVQRHEALLLGVSLMLEEREAGAAAAPPPPPPQPHQPPPAPQWAPTADAAMFSGLSVMGGAPSGPPTQPPPQLQPQRVAVSDAAPFGDLLMMGGDGGGRGGGSASTEALETLSDAVEGASLIARVGPAPTEPAHVPPAMQQEHTGGGMALLEGAPMPASDSFMSLL